MSTASAASTASIHYVLRDLYVRSGDETRSKLLERYVRLVPHLPRAILLSMNRPERHLRVPPLSRWLDRVEGRIQSSVALEEHHREEPGRWLSEDVAQAGLQFFRKTADLLPGEPFIYASRRGDLVAEFTGTHGTLTSIISPRFVILFASIDENPYEKKFDSRADVSGDALRGELKNIGLMLRTGWHGSSMAPAD